MGRNSISRVINSFGYPRSGNTFLRSSLYLLYPEHTVGMPKHTLVEAQRYINQGKTLVVFRNPLDAISSWSIYKQEGYLSPRFEWHKLNDIDDDIKFYCRIYNYVLSNLENIILLDFDCFTNNLDYLVDKLSPLELGPHRAVSIEDVKESMLADERRLNLPRETKSLIQGQHSIIQNSPIFKDAILLHNDLKINS